MTTTPAPRSRATGAPARPEAPAVGIVGGGIGGLAAALTLHAAGIRATVFEQAETIRELGVGINVQPNAIAVLADLGLLAELGAVGLPTRELLLGARDGTVVRVEPRGLHAGHPVPQISIHRGRLQKVLLDAVLTRLGPGSVRCGHRLVDVVHDDVGARAGAELVFATADGPAAKPSTRWSGSGRSATWRRTSSCSGHRRSTPCRSGPRPAAAQLAGAGRVSPVQNAAMLRAVSRLISGQAIGKISVPCTVPITTRQVAATPARSSSR
jgi:hypothetical protein